MKKEKILQENERLKNKVLLLYKTIFDFEQNKKFQRKVGINAQTKNGVRKTTNKTTVKNF
jgi:hypothetical protein